MKHDLQKFTDVVLTRLGFNSPGSIETALERIAEILVKDPSSYNCPRCMEALAEVCELLHRVKNGRKS